MCTLLAADLYASRLVLRFVEAGRPFLASLLRSGSVPFDREAEAVVAALWDRADRRPLAERLARPGVPQDPQRRERALARLLEAGLLVEAAVDERTEWLAKQERELGELPLVDQVELTNACPFTCLFCPRGRGQMRRQVGHLDLGLLAEIVDQVKHLEQRKPFGLHHFGESLLHPDAAGAVRVVAQAGLQAELSVNPILLDDATGEEVLDAGVGVLIVSMDGLDDETLVRLRGRAAGPFAEVERRVEQLIARAAQLQRPPQVMISMVATKHNRHQWDQLFARYRRPEQPWLTPVLRLLEDFGDPEIMPVGVFPLRQLCGAPCHFVSVLWDGRVVPCCHDFDGAVVYGDLRTQSLAEIWQGEAVQRFRARWREGDFAADEPCARCRWYVDRYLADDSIALTDAWTPNDWP